MTDTSSQPETMKVESGVRFPNAAPGGVDVQVSATFLESGNQLQQVFIGLQPVLVIQPEYDADTNSVDLVTIAVDLDPAGLVETLEVLLDAAKTMAAEQAEAIAEHIAACDHSETQTFREGGGSAHEKCLLCGVNLTAQAEVAAWEADPQ